MDSAAPEPFAVARLSMVEDQLRQRGIHDARVLEVMAEVPRHEFVDPQSWGEAYADRPVIIGKQQTTSQPYMIAAMLQAAGVQPHEKVLEIGTGSGYQTALLARLTDRVFSVERHATLTKEARQALDRMGCANITLATGDGSLGLKDHAPYDVIIVAAAAPRVPPALVEQLAEGGRLVIPVGTVQDQILQVICKQDTGYIVKSLDACRFVPLIGEQGFAG